ncbi:MAG TPA: GGDEF domain-containing protein [Candidatus Acidoferrales bacterium]
MAQATAPALTSAQPNVTAAQISADLRRMDRRQWWLWSAACAIMLLLTMGVASFVFPSLLRGDMPGPSFGLGEAVRGLVGLVLLFNCYTVYQQVVLNRLRQQMSQQIQSLANVESLATEVYKLAALDQLTGLYNRRSAEKRLEEEISRAIRHARPLNLLLMDIDNLKEINDTHGHAAGDVVLMQFGERLRRAIRGSDQGSRIGGDEFMVVLPECPSGQVQHVIDRLRVLTVEYEGAKITVHFSAGWKDYHPGETALEFMRRVDEALFADKRGKCVDLDLQTLDKAARRDRA